MLINLSEIDADYSWNYRGNVGDVSEMVLSLKTEGQKQSLNVSRKPNGRYDLNAGFRRFKAMTLLEWEQAECIVDSATTNTERKIVNLIENVGRENAPFAEEAKAIGELLERLGPGGEQLLANKLGKSRNWVQERNIYLKLPVPVQTIFTEGHITVKELRYAYTILLREGTEECLKVMKCAKENRQLGKKFDLATRAREGRNVTKQRTAKEIETLQSNIAAQCGSATLVGKVLGWCIGFVSDDELNAALDSEIGYRPE